MTHARLHRALHRALHRGLGRAFGLRQQGVTLVELLVATAISTMIAVAAMTALVVSRQGFVAVDAASGLRDNARFAVDLTQRLGVQAGFKDAVYAATTRPVNNLGVAVNPPPGVAGFNNATASATDPVNSPAARSVGDVGYGSDILILRFQAPETFPGSRVADRSMIDCMGRPASAVPTGRDDTLVSILHVELNRGEPSLMCTTVNGSGTASPARPMVEGVENFQVLYGVDGVVPNTAPLVTSTDAIADRFLRADQMLVPGDPVGTNANWRRVRSLRIGMVLRGPSRSAPDVGSQIFYPLGLAPAAAGGADGGAMSSSSDPGSAFTPAVDGRFRQAVTFTVHLRNDQGL
jgi:type IV pilus assembly protein PilW